VPDPSAPAAEVGGSAAVSLQVEAMAGLGLPERGIARLLGMDPEAFRSLYAAELECGLFKANAKVAENLFRRATGEGREAVTAAIFWLKARAGWKETSIHALAGSEIRPTLTIHIDKSDAEL
jgi:hypothetical protein